MTDAQMITLTVAILAVFAGILFNNSRIGDLRNSVDARFHDFERRFDDMSRHIDDKFDLLAERLQHMEENITRVLDDHERRLEKIESRR